MAYDEKLAERVRKALKNEKNVSEKKMFGGICVLLNGNMCMGIINDELMLRLGDEGAAAALKEPHVRQMDFTGKPMKSMVYVAPAGFKSDKDLNKWVKTAVDFAKSLPPKK